MTLRAWLLAVLLAPLLAEELAPPPAPANGIGMAVDARDLPRGLLRARLAIPVAAGTADLVFPRWIPGTHAPGNPVQNLVDLHISGNGAELRWLRDESDPWIFHVTVPPGVAGIEVALAYIADQPADRSSIGADVHAGQHMGAINWNTVVLYPAGRPVAAIPVDLVLALPAGWTWGSALTAQDAGAGGAVRFARCSLRDLVDRPLIAGDALHALRLANHRGPPAFLQGASDDGAALDPAWGDALARVVDEGMAVVGRADYREYHFLLAAGMGHLGLEHAESTLSGIEPGAFADLTTAEFHDRSVMPHEFFHTWCGKHVRPAGMIVPDFQTVQRTGLLWVYEGLTTYYGYLLSVRSGLADEAQFRDQLGGLVADLARQSGRGWRSVEDTARAGWLLRSGSKHRHDLRRGQEYYAEGALFWMDADVRIRRASHGARSLDDVCRVLFAPPVETGASRGYEERDIIAALQQVQPDDWADLVRRRITDVAPRLDLAFLRQAGWDLVYDDKPDGEWLAAAKAGQYMDLRDSLGCLLARGQVYGLVSGGPMDLAGIREGVQVVGVGDDRLSPATLLAGLDAAKASGSLTLKIWEGGGESRDVQVACATGARIPRLQRVADAPDLLAEILAPLAGPAPVPAAAAEPEHAVTP
jgi:predicted metalloprotease with PDZ domain